MSARYRKLYRMPTFWLASGFGSGLAPKAPGTVGSVVALLPWWFLQALPLPYYLLSVVLTFAAGVWAAQRVIAALGAEDPGVVVIDEWIGLWIALIAVPAGWGWVLAGLLLFRAFDILKPWPVSWADRELKGGLGTMLDDALAGGYALLVLQVLAWAVDGTGAG